MCKELMNTKEVAQYLDIHPKQVYRLIKAGKIPCTRVTGKWLFPKKLIDEWIETNASVPFQTKNVKNVNLENKFSNLFRLTIYVHPPEKVKVPLQLISQFVFSSFL